MSIPPYVKSISILEVWRRLGGPPLRGFRGPAFWRNGDAGNVYVDPEKNWYWDHARNAGGDVVDLARAVLGCDFKGAISWLDAERFFPPRHKLTTEERRAFAHRKKAERRFEEQFRQWRFALIQEANERKQAAIDSRDDEALERFARLCLILEGGSRETMRGLFRKMDVEAVAVLIKMGRQAEAQAKELCAAIVVALARAATEGKPDAA